MAHRDPCARSTVSSQEANNIYDIDDTILPNGKTPKYEKEVNLRELFYRLHRVKALNDPQPRQNARI